MATFNTIKGLELKDDYIAQKLTTDSNSQEVLVWMNKYGKIGRIWSRITETPSPETAETTEIAIVS
jgi:hypothetical protein